MQSGRRKSVQAWVSSSGPETATICGAWPIASRKRRRSAAAMRVVRVLTSGWKLRGSRASSARSITTRHAIVGIVHRREGRDRARLDAERRPHRLGLAEGEPAGSPDLAMQMLEVDRGTFLGGKQEQAVLAVDKKEVLGVRARNFAAQVARFFDAEQRRMLDRRGLDAEAGEQGEKVFGRRGHERPNCSEIEFSSNRVLKASPVALAGRFWHRTALYAAYIKFGCGCSSGVEHNLAKVGVVGSNPIARSKIAARKSKSYGAGLNAVRRLFFRARPRRGRAPHR